MNYAVTLVTAARYPEALVQFQKVIASEPNFGPPHYYLSHLYAMTGRFGDAIAEFQNRNPFLKVGECGDLTTTGSSLPDCQPYRSPGIVVVNFMELITAASPVAPGCSHDSRPQAGHNARRCARWRPSRW